MSASDVQNALKVPGRIVVGSSLDFSAAFPHDGTELGLVQAVSARHKETYSPVKVEDFGVETEIVDFLEAGERWELAFALRGHDPDALSATFRNVVTGASSGKTRINSPGPRGEGVLRSVARAVGLLFAPLDPEHPAVYFPQALPALEAARDIVHHRSEERIVLVGFVATRSGTAAGSATQVGLLEDLTEITP